MVVSHALREDSLETHWNESCCIKYVLVNADSASHIVTPAVGIPENLLQYLLDLEFISINDQVVNLARGSIRGGNGICQQHKAALHSSLSDIICLLWVLLLGQYYPFVTLYVSNLCRRGVQVSPSLDSGLGMLMGRIKIPFQFCEQKGTKVYTVV